MPRLDPESEARQLTDGQLEPRGWAMKDRREVNISAALGVTREEMMQDIAIPGILTSILRAHQRFSARGQP
jgi:hypothetical protein